MHRFVRSYVWCNGSIFSLCFPLNGAVVQMARMPPCHGGDSGVRVPSVPQYIRRVRLVVRTTLNELTCFQTNENVQQLRRLILSISSRKRGFDSFTLRKLVASSNGRITY